MGTGRVPILFGWLAYLSISINGGSCLFNVVKATLESSSSFISGNTVQYYFICLVVFPSRIVRSDSKRFICFHLKQIPTLALYILLNSLKTKRS